MDYSEYKIGEVGPMGKMIKELIFHTNNVIVYMDCDDDIQWSTLNYDDYHENFGDIQNKINFWESMSEKLFSKSDSYDYKCLLASSFARILDDKNLDFANQIIDQTVFRMQKHGREILKQDYILSSFKCTLIVLILLISLVIFKVDVINYITQNAYEIIITSLFGGIGAFIFTVIRTKSYTPDIEIGKSIHKIDGALRIFYGLILGLVVSIAIKSNVVLGFVNQLDMTIYLKAFLGVVAGASEVFIPNLIKQTEEQSISPS